MPEQTLIRFEGYELDLAARSLSREGVPIALTSKTFDLLRFLAEHPQQIISKERLLAAVWPDSYVEESNLSQHIFLLRKALAASGQAGRVVITIPGKGYQFAATVDGEPQASADPALGHRNGGPTPDPSPTAHDSPESVPSENIIPPTVAPIQRKTTFSPSGRLWLAGIALILLIAGAIVWQRMHPAPTEHIDLVLSELENSTGDGDFDHSLNQALQIDLEQSPFLNLLSRSAIRDTLVQMQRKSDQGLTPALAQEVCQRNSARVMLHGAISRIGTKYLLLLNAESCISGKHLASYKVQADSKEDVLPALDRAAGEVRKQLGESAASREQYQISIAQATTPSLDALLAYNQAGESFRHGDMKAAQLALQRAISLDPNFASAYRILGSSYYNLGDYSMAAENYKKAFDLRERTTERERLGIEVMYYAYALNDYEESIRRTRQFLQIYPNVANSWVSLSNLYGRLGDYPQAVDAAQHAMQVDPHSGVAAVELARSYMYANRFADAKAVANAAIAQGKDHWDVHSILFQIAFAEHDAAKIESEGKWGLTHQHANTSLRDLAVAAASEGKLREARDDFARARTEAIRGGETDFANGVLLDEARILTEYEETSQALSVLRQLSGDTGEPGDSGVIASLKAANGDTSAAQHFVTSSAALDTRNTVKVCIYIPLVRAQLALKAHKPAEAVKALEAARPYQLANFQIPYLRAEAETKSGMLDAAVSDYRLILSNRGVDPISPLYILAHLRLGQVFILQGKPDLALHEYPTLLADWKGADSDLPPLIQARREYQKLLNAHP